MTADLDTMITGPLPTSPGAYILVRWKGGGAYERYVLDNTMHWANVSNELRHEFWELQPGRIDGYWVLS